MTKWRLDKLQFVLSEVEDLIEEEDRSLRKRLQDFEIQTGLGQLKSLYEGDPTDPLIGTRVFEKLTPFYETGFMFRAIGNEWLMTDFFWRGQLFHLTPEDVVTATTLIREISPLQVQKTEALAVLKQLKMEFVRTPRTAQAYLFKPALKTAYILISDLPEIWSTEHIRATHELLNKSFTF